eukprot:jgi/Botrbrau1/5926/Bobra.0366s0100.1
MICILSFWRPSQAHCRKVYGPRDVLWFPTLVDRILFLDQKTCSWQNVLRVNR